MITNESGFNVEVLDSAGERHSIRRRAIVRLSEIKSSTTFPTRKTVLVLSNRDVLFLNDNYDIAKKVLSGKQRCTEKE